jgi:hypothetical protein
VQLLPAGGLISRVGVDQAGAQLDPAVRSVGERDPQPKRRKVLALPGGWVGWWVVCGAAIEAMFNSDKSCATARKSKQIPTAKSKQIEHPNQPTW